MNHKAFVCLLGLLAFPGFAAAQWSTTAPAAPAAAPPAAAKSMPPPITQDQLLERQAKHDPTLFLIDARTPQEYAAGHVPGAVNIPYDQVAAHLGEIPKDKDVVVYCHSGRRAGLAAETLEKAGYKRLLHLQGDMQAWQKDGRPVEAAAETKPGG
ncbi:MAG: rhodanese-like domain-containing protein [Gammaproteobacteria bacterium]|nr:rhodanese-like domain-containing protein [Gammaproteobacteria bacterium]